MSTAKAKKISEKFEKEVLGLEEPKTINPLNYATEIQKALNAYNQLADDKKKKTWAMKHIVETRPEEQMKLFETAPDWKYKHVGILCRINSNGLYLSEEHLAKIDEILDKIVEEETKAKEARAKKREVAPPKPEKPKSIVNLICAPIVAEFNNHVDEFLLHGKELPELKRLYHELNCTRQNTLELVDSLKGLLVEINEAAEGKDEQLNEAYSFTTKTKLKKLSVWLESIPSTLADYLLGKKTTVVRIKPKSPLQLVKGLRYLKEFPELELVSVPPTKIIGASFLVIYDTKNRMLSYFTGTELSVKNSSIANFDLAHSKLKKLRKPEQIKELMGLSKKQFIAEFDKLTTVEKPLNPRTNVDTILIKVS